MSNSLKEKLSDQQRYFELISELFACANATEHHYSAIDLDVRLDLLENYWVTFSANDLALQRSKELLASERYFKENYFNTALNNYLLTKARFKDRIEALKPPAPAAVLLSAAAGTSRVANPGAAEAVNTYIKQADFEKIKLPSFSGAQEEWESFKDKFTSLVLDDPNIPHILKRQRLDNCLTGEALDLLKGIKATTSNFDVAWAALKRQYDNPHLRMSKQFDALLNMPHSSEETIKHLNTLISIAKESVNVFTALERPVLRWDDVFIHCIVSKLSNRTRLLWATELGQHYSEMFPTLENLFEFLQVRIQTLLTGLSESASSGTDKRRSSSQAGKGKSQSLPPYQSDKSKSAQANKTKRSNDAAVHAAITSDDKKSKTPCSYCQGLHFISFCKQFSACSQVQRNEFVTSNKLCENCLNSTHQVSQCSSTSRCLVCNAKHHTRLHIDTPASSAPLMGATVAASHHVQSSASIATVPVVSRRKLLATAVAVLQSATGLSMTVQLLLDNCAEESFVSENVVQVLSLSTQATSVNITSVGGNIATTANKRVSLTLKSLYDSDFSLDFSALVVKRVTSHTPSKEVPLPPWPPFDGLSWADPCFGKPAQVDCILDAAAYATALREGLIHGPPHNNLVAINTVFGWVLTGGLASSEAPTTESSSVHLVVNEDLNQTLTKFWVTEEVPTCSASLSPAEQECYEHFNNTHSRNSEGRFVIRLPFQQRIDCSSMEGIARACFERLEKRFARHPHLASQYRQFMAEYFALGHMERVPDHQVTSLNSIYIPHHPVFKNDDSHKIRVVFNASQPDTQGRSLNSLLHAGPKLQEDIVAVICRWSFFPVVFSCDVEKMFRQFLVHPDDCDFQRILWRDSPQETISHFRLKTVTYGTACAPFLANACMLQLALEVERDFPQVAELLRLGRYVDDFFGGGDDVEKTLVLRDRLIEVLASAGMTVGKWSSNSPQVVPEAETLGADKGALFQTPEVVSALGLKWLASEDAFTFRLPKAAADQGLDNSRVTKRVIASGIARLFDPLGWIAPVVIRSKCLLQKLWFLGNDWDEPVPEQMAQAWQTFQKELGLLEELRIPRWTGTFSDSTWSMHCFCDASESAFAAVVYAVVEHDGTYQTKLLASKSKVAPIRTLSLPRLELCGAVLLSDLASYLLQNLPMVPSSIWCWSDSKVVLFWLREHPSRWKTFVANRVSHIHSQLPSATWRHVRSADNPADLPSRGLTPAQLLNSDLWWHGPPWLRQSSAQWPSVDMELKDCHLEERKPDQARVLIAQQPNEISGWLESFSSLERIVRILSYIYRWKTNALRRTNNPHAQGLLSASEIARGREWLWRLVQQQVFTQEIAALSSGHKIRRGSPIYKQVPFLDDAGLLRVGGRLQRALLSYEEKFPIILPARHHVTRLLIRHAHYATMHGGATLVQSHLLRRFWVIKARNVIRQVLRRCVRCARFNAQTVNQRMAPLPLDRVRPSRPFTYTGVDFAGPFHIKLSAGRGVKTQKGYVALFVCFVTKAIHLEVVPDLTSQSFLDAFYTFTARRGLCKKVFSDNGTNFVGAERALSLLFSEASASGQLIASSLALDEIKWYFNPPRAPHFGGIWEANIKVFKRHFYRTVGERKLTFFQFTSICARIEACLNSRPICAVSTESDDLPALTPGHFFIGAPLKAPPETNLPLNDLNWSALDRWKLVGAMSQDFWARWRKEYLAELQSRSKWIDASHQFQEGDVVLFKDGLLPPTRWPLARIKQLLPGSDGLNRVAIITTAAGEYTRATSKLIWLPTNEEVHTYYKRVKAKLEKDGLDNQPDSPDPFDQDLNEEL